jgi:hypothetical protein
MSETILASDPTIDWTDWLRRENRILLAVR